MTEVFYYKAKFIFIILKDSDYSGEVTFGRIETKYMAENFKFFDVTSEDYWQVGLSDVMVLFKIIDWK